MNSLSLTPQAENKDIKFIGKSDKNTRDSGEGDFFKSLISSLLSEISDEKNRKFLLENLFDFSGKNGYDELDTTEISTLSFAQKPKEIPQEDLSKNDKVSIDLLLKIALSLQNDKNPQFPSLSESLEKRLQKPDVLKAFRSATTIGDLIKIAKENDIEVKNFQIFKEDAALDQKEKQIIKKINSEEILRLISFRNHQFSQKEKKVVLTPHTTSPTQSVAKETSGISTKISVLQSFMQTETKKKNITPQNQAIDKDIKSITETLSPSKGPKKRPIDSIQKETLQNTAPSIESLKERPSDTESKQTLFEDKLSQQIKSPKNQNRSTIITKLAEDPKEPSQSIPAKETKTDEIHTDETAEMEISHSHELKTTPKEFLKTKQSTPSKHTFQSFAETFKEKVESYKPPLMKIKMELNPKNLGEVDVTLLHRGNNLHVTINSNPSTIAIFTQNQNEFKNAIVNMGFTGLQMNFSENGKNGQHERNQKQHAKSNLEKQTENESYDGIEIVIPHYV